MGKHSVRVALLLGTVVAGGCPEYIMRSAVTAVAAEIRPANSPVAGQLLSIGNPKGEGVVVYVKPAASCAPQYTWIWLNERSGAYALDEISRSFTPDLRVLSLAPADVLRRLGADATELIAAVRLGLCGTAPHAYAPLEPGGIPVVLWP